MAEREGFEPPIPLRVCRISSAVHSTTLPPLRTSSLFAMRRSGCGRSRFAPPHRYRTALVACLLASSCGQRQRTKRRATPNSRSAFVARGFEDYPMWRSDLSGRGLQSDLARAPLRPVGFGFKIGLEQGSDGGGVRAGAAGSTAQALRGDVRQLPRERGRRVIRSSRPVTDEQFHLHPRRTVWEPLRGGRWQAGRGMAVRQWRRRQVCNGRRCQVGWRINDPERGMNGPVRGASGAAMHPRHRCNPYEPTGANPMSLSRMSAVIVLSAVLAMLFAELVQIYSRPLNVVTLCDSGGERRCP